MEAKLVTVRRAGPALAVSAALLASLLTAGCAAGQYAQSATEQETTDGTSARIGTMTLAALAIAAPSDGVSYAAGADVPLRVVVINSGQKADTLTSITSPSITGWTAYAPDASASGSTSVPSSTTAGSSASALTSITVNGHSRKQFGPQQEAGAPPNGTLLLQGVRTTLRPGTAIDLTFTFSRNGSVTAHVPVQLSKNPPTSIIPGPSATGEQG